MSVPNSFCFICTKNCSHELIGMLLTLSIHHKNSKVYGFVDDNTYNKIISMNPKLNLHLYMLKNLNKYSNLNRKNMVHNGIWDEFQMQKANVIKYALQTEKDTMFLDSDIFFLKPLNCIDNKKDIAVSPHYIKKQNTDEVGYYNGGCLWTKTINVANDWIEFTKTSRYHDQASIEDLVKKYNYQEFGEEINFMPWRVLLSKNPNEVFNNIHIHNGEICFKRKPIVFLHTHFNDIRFQKINQLCIRYLKQLHMYKELAIIDRIMYKKWIIHIPKQPRNGIWKHKNDSFRELAYLYANEHLDVEVKEINNGHCWLGNNILLYDRPTIEWFNNDLLKASIILLGNGDIEKEGKILKDKKMSVCPWIFWPRNPKKIENFIENHDRVSYENRSIHSMFIGNIENSVQNRYRNTSSDWSSVIEVFHITNGMKHKFTPDEYMEIMSKSKFGLCLRGYGSKCHREVELMSFGTIPIITKEVSIKSYMNPPEENIHYIYVKDVEDLKSKLDVITPEKWEQMSKACYIWYQKNVHSKLSINTFLTSLLFE